MPWVVYVDGVVIPGADKVELKPKAKVTVYSAGEQLVTPATGSHVVAVWAKSSPGRGRPSGEVRLT